MRNGALQLGPAVAVRQSSLRLIPLFPHAQVTAPLSGVLCRTRVATATETFPSPLCVHPTVAGQQPSAGSLSVGLGCDAPACEVSSPKPDILWVLLLSPACARNAELLLLANYAVMDLSVLSERG